MELNGFVIDVDLKAKAADLHVTKRTMLSVGATLFDPLEFVAPVTHAKANDARTLSSTLRLGR